MWIRVCPLCRAMLQKHNLRGNPVLLRMGLVIIQFFDQTPTRHTTLRALRLARSECHPQAAMTHS